MMPLACFLPALGDLIKLQADFTIGCSGNEILIISALQPSHYHKHSDVAAHLTRTEAETS